MIPSAADSAKRWSAGESDIIICQEIPDHCDSDREKFCNVKRKLLLKKPEEQIIDPQSDNRDNDKTAVLDQHFRIMTFKCPDAVQEIV